jgi:type VI secretion system FHA domain protein
VRLAVDFCQENGFVPLTLEVIATTAAKLGAAHRVFGAAGGSIGRREDCDLVLPDTRVSSLHAVISCRNAIFSVEDRSTNGTCLNSPENRLPRGQPCELNAGDRIIIVPYELEVTISREPSDAVPRWHDADLPARRVPDRQYIGSDGIDADDPFELRPTSPEPVSDEELDPLRLIDPVPRSAPAPRAPSAKDLAVGSPLAGHYQPPAVLPVPVGVPPPGSIPIPPDYDPLRPDQSSTGLGARPSSAWPAAAREVEAPQPPPPVVTPGRSLTPPLAREAVEAGTPPAPAAESVSVPGGGDLAAVLAGAGLDRSLVTAELAGSLGRILRIVVSGVMDVLRARQHIKDEFRMYVTHFRPSENNPLKYSANVDDALHNLLVKRNVAYLGPVEAFEEAFADLRDHQIAMLAGMRVAFESTLAEFDPDRLQQLFDRQLKGGSLLNLPAKLRYWELYRDWRQEILNDPEATFRRLFGEEFARAYEEQLDMLEAGRRAGAGSPGVARRPEI